MKSALTLLCIFALTVLAFGSALSGPILKPAKYYGPIPRRSFSLRLGFLGGATAEEMHNTLDALVLEKSGEAFTDDFKNSIIIDGAYTVKLHPKFAVRTSISLTLLRSESNGIYVPSTGDPPFPDRKYKRVFNVELTTLEADAIYFFTDASVQEFQPYMGGGFSVWIPHAVYKEDMTDYWLAADSVIARPTVKKTDWSFEAGVQGILGALYYVNNTFAFNVEARYHIAQSRFPLEIVTMNGSRQEINFLINYTGFILNVGILHAF